MWQHSFVQRTLHFKWSSRHGICISQSCGIPNVLQVARQARRESLIFYQPFLHWIFDCPQMFFNFNIDGVRYNNVMNSRMWLGKTLEERMRIVIEDYARVKTLVTAGTKLGTKDIPMKTNLLHTALMTHQYHTRQSTRESLQPRDS